MKKRIKIPLKILYYVLFLLFIYVLQTSVFSHFTIKHANPTIFPLVVASAAIFEGCVKGGVIGLFAGMLCDISYNQPTIQFTLILTLLGIFIGILADTVLAKGFPTYLLSSVFALFVSAAAQMFGHIVFRDVSPKELISLAAAQILYSLLFLLPIYICVRKISRLLGSY